MSLAPNWSAQHKEKQWLEHFLQYAIDGDQRYLDIVKPYLLAVSEYAVNKTPIAQWNRHYVHLALWLTKFKKLKKITADNLMLKEVLDYLQTIHID